MYVMGLTDQCASVIYIVNNLFISHNINSKIKPYRVVESRSKSYLNDEFYSHTIQNIFILGMII